VTPSSEIWAHSWASPASPPRCRQPADRVGYNVGTDSMLSSAFPPSTTQPSDTLITHVGNRYNVNLPASTVNGSIGLSLLAGKHLLDLELSAAQNEGRARPFPPPA